MASLNYNHLFYFLDGRAREGGVVRASEELTVSQSTISVYCPRTRTRRASELW